MQNILKPGAEHCDLSPKMVADNPEVTELKADAEYVEEITEEYKATEKKLVRKLDLTLVPMLWVLYLFNYLDR